MLKADGARGLLRVPHRRRLPAQDGPRRGRQGRLPRLPRGPRLGPEEPAPRRRGDALHRLPRRRPRPASRRPTAATRPQGLQRLPRPALLRRRKLLKASLHAPVAGGGCDSCHAAAGEPEALRPPGGRRGALRQLPRRRVARRRRQGPARPGQERRVPRLPRPARLGERQAHPRPRQRRSASAATRSMGQKVTRPAQGGRPPARAASPATRRTRPRRRSCSSPTALGPVRELPRQDGEGGGRQEGVSTPPSQGGDCIGCHDPHGSNSPGMMAGRQDRVCYGCHADAAGEVRQDLHPQAGAGGELQRLPRRRTPRTTPSCSRRSGRELCLKCHGDAHEGAGHGVEPQALRRRQVPRLPRPARLQLPRPPASPTRRATCLQVPRRTRPRRRRGRSRSTPPSTRASARSATARTRRGCRSSCWPRPPTSASPATRRWGRGRRRRRCTRRSRTASTCHRPHAGPQAKLLVEPAADSSASSATTRRTPASRRRTSASTRPG